MWGERGNKMRVGRNWEVWCGWEEGKVMLDDGVMEGDRGRGG